MNVRVPLRKNVRTLNFEYLDDTVAQYYRPVQGYFMKKRLDLALHHIRKSIISSQLPCTLDVGYGGGTFILNLASISKEVHGIDLHDKMSIVNETLNLEGVKANLVSGNILKMPYDSESYDLVTCISVLEHFKSLELKQAIFEILRVIKPGGIAVIGFPTKNIFANFIIKNILGFNPDEIHPSGHSQILNAVSESGGKIERKTIYPPLPLDFALYVVLTIKKF
jgi:2-polyprenyl-3-methyl-5-hydroxy-6-metoxy-1,4-benzoquinol methylase